MQVILSNENVINYFAGKYNLSSREGTSIENQLFQYSQYQRVIFGFLLRICVGSISNNPTKSIIALATDYEQRTTREIARKANEMLGITDESKLNLNSLGVNGHFKESLLEITQLCIDGKRRDSPTCLFEADSLHCKSKTYTKFSKTLDGFLFADPFAHLGIISSIIDGLPSGYKIWSTANSRGSSSAQETAILPLYWLLGKKDFEGDENQFAQEIFSLQETSQENDGRFRLVKNKLRSAIIRLANIKLLTRNRISSQRVYSLKLTEEGIKFLTTIEPLLDFIGFYQALQQNDGNVSYAMLNRMVTPDLGALLNYRLKNLDEAIKTQEGYNEFMQQMIQARERHLKDSKSRRAISRRAILF